jgi:hypothetical protein
MSPFRKTIPAVAVSLLMLAGCGTTTPSSPRKHTDAYVLMMGDCILTEHQPRAWCAKEVPQVAKQEMIPIWR